MNFKDKSKEQKIAEIFSSNFCRGERHYVAIYLNALRKNDIETLNEWERFGISFHKILSNKRTFDRAILFGIHDLEFDDCGWLKCGKLFGLRKIEFQTEKGGSRTNYIEIGHGNNGTWAYGINYSTGSAGGGYCCNIWSDLYYSEGEAIQAGLKELLRRHNEAKESMYKKDTCGNYKHEYSQKIVKLIEAKLNGSRQPVQLELF